MQPLKANSVSSCMGFKVPSPPRVDHTGPDPVYICYPAGHGCLPPAFSFFSSGLSDWTINHLLEVIGMVNNMEATRRRSSTSRRKSLLNDDDHLAALGVKQELRRNFSPLSMLGLAFAILNSWTALSASLSLALPSGGPTSVIWGLMTAGVCNLCLAASLAEFLSAYPTAGGVSGVLVLPLNVQC